MKFQDLPPSAQETVARVAAGYGLEPASLLEPRQRTPEAQTARTESICLLDIAKLKGRRRYRLPDIAAWFGVSRNSIYVQRAKAPKFTPRRQASEKAAEPLTD